MNSIKRGQESWNYIYIALGFAISFEGTIIQMLPMNFPLNVICFVVAGLATGWLFLFNPWFHNKLIGFKARYEDREWTL